MLVLNSFSGCPTSATKRSKIGIIERLTFFTRNKKSFHHLRHPQTKGTKKSICFLTNSRGQKSVLNSGKRTRTSVSSDSFISIPVLSFLVVIQTSKVKSEFEKFLGEQEEEKSKNKLLFIVSSKKTQNSKLIELHFKI